MARRLIVAAVVFLGIAATPGLVSFGQDTQGKAGKGDGKDGQALQGLTDEKFVMMASAMDLAEINLGRVAVQKAMNPEVKQFGQKMVADHTKSSKELLMLLGKKQGLKAASTMDQEHQALHDKLSQLKGADFDQMYMMHMAQDHKKAVALFKHQASEGKDEDLKAFAAKTLPVVQEHLKMAEQLAHGKGGVGTTDKKGGADR